MCSEASLLYNEKREIDYYEKHVAYCLPFRKIILYLRHKHFSGMTEKYIKYILLMLLLAILPIDVSAQTLRGVVEDKDGVTIPGATISYPGHKGLMVISDADGNFEIERHNGWMLAVSCVGLKTERIKVNADVRNPLRVVLREAEESLHEVVVHARKGRYSRKNNPAVELMKRVIAAKKSNDLRINDYYSYNRYQKLSIALNNIRENDMKKGIFQKLPWLKDYVEKVDYNKKNILPISYSETASRHIYRREPQNEKTYITGKHDNGLNSIFQTGDILSEVLKEVFTDVDIYDDYVRLLQYPFPSPIGRTAVSFYHFYIEDTVMVAGQRCIHLEFTPSNQQDFGFRGSLYVTDDSALHVKRCDLTIPKTSNVNYVDEMTIRVEYSKLSNGQWVLSDDDMSVEMSLINEHAGSFYVSRSTRREDYDFSPLPDKLFRGKVSTITDPDANIRDDDFWRVNRAVELTHAEANMDEILHRLKQGKHYRWVMMALQALLENYVETGSHDRKSRFDIGPLNTIVSHNFIDGLRFRLSGKTTAKLNPHFFWSGFYAYGAKSREHYYDSKLTYSINKKQNDPFEFPQRNIIFETTRDVMSPSDVMSNHDKDNVFMSVRTQKVEQMYFINKQKLSFVYETNYGLAFNSSIKLESNRPTGDLIFQPVATDINDGDPLIRRIRTTELNAGLRYSPGQKYVNSKQRRSKVNLDAPEFTLSHTVGMKGFIGGDYRMNYTEAGLYKRQWLGSWGYVDARARAGAQWNQVPFPLLIMPPISLNYFFEKQEIETEFNLMRNMEFLTDRMLFCSLSWDMNGKLLNRVPLVKKLHWREFFGVKAMWGKLTDKNNPWLERNANSEILMRMPDESYLFDGGKPYVELLAGVHNILGLFAVDFVHRLNYNEHANVSKNGVRFSIMLSF